VFLSLPSVSWASGDSVAHALLNASSSSGAIIPAPALGSITELVSITWTVGASDVMACNGVTSNDSYATFTGGGTVTFAAPGLTLPEALLCYNYGSNPGNVYVYYDTLTVPSSSPAADAIGVAGGIGTDTGIAGGVESLASGVVALGAGLVPVLIVVTLAWFVFRWLRGQS